MKNIKKKVTVYPSREPAGGPRNLETLPELHNMASSVPTTAEDELMMAEGGSLTRRTLLDRERDFKYFTDYLSSRTKTTIGEFLGEGGDLKEFQDHLLKFFFSRRVNQEGQSQRPK